MSNRDFNYQFFLKRILRTAKFDEVNKYLNEFEYQVNNDLDQKIYKLKDINKKKMYLEQMHFLKKQFFNPIANYYSNLQEERKSDVIPEYIRKFKYYNFDWDKIKNYLASKEMDIEKLQYLNWLEFLAELCNNCDLILKINKKCKKRIKFLLNIIDNEKNYLTQTVNKNQSSFEENEENEDNEQQAKKIIIQLNHIKRQPNDNITKLDLKSTVLLFNTLSENKIIQEISWLKSINVAKAIEVLTGYSYKQTRDVFNANFSEENYKDLINAMEKMIRKLKEKVKNNKNF